jgi:hypothetical protein
MVVSKNDQSRSCQQIGQLGISPDVFAQPVRYLYNASQGAALVPTDTFNL